MNDEVEIAIRMHEDARSLSSVATVFRSLDTLVGAGAWLDISEPRSTMMSAAHEGVIENARRHPTSRTGRTVRAALGDHEPLSPETHGSDFDSLIMPPDPLAGLEDTWSAATDASSVDWLRRVVSDVSPDAYQTLTGWAQVTEIGRKSPTVIQILLVAGGGGLARFGPRYVIDTVKAFVEGWHDIRVDSLKYAEQKASIRARGKTVVEREQARKEAAELAATACRQARLALTGESLAPEALALAERLALVAVSDLAKNEDLDDVTLSRR